jgi:alpha-1,3-mannosyltransferase
MKRVAIKTSEKDTEMTDEQKNFLKSFEKGMKQKFGDSQPKPQPKIEEDPKKVEIHFDQCTQLALLPIFLVNFIGVACSRSLHYQFYIWYFHSLPHLVWFTNFHTSFKILLLFLIEYCWNQYPSTNYSSLLLHVCHTFMLVGVIFKLYKETFLARKVINAHPPKDQ